MADSRSTLGELSTDLFNLIGEFATSSELDTLAKANARAGGDKLWMNQFKNHFPRFYDKLNDSSQSLNWEDFFSHNKDKIKSQFPLLFQELKTQPIHSWKAFFEICSKIEYKDFYPSVRSLFMRSKDYETQEFKAEFKVGMEVGSLQLTDLLTRDASGHSILYWLRKNNLQDSLDFIYQEFIRQHFELRPIPIHEVLFEDRTLLDWAILCQQPIAEIDRVEGLGCSIDRNGDSLQSVYYAASFGKVSTFRKWITPESKHLASDEKSNTSVLNNAAAGGNLENVKYLLTIPAVRNGINLIEKGYIESNEKFNGFAALHWSIYRKNTQMAQVLLEAGAAVDLRAFYLAIENGQLDILKLLIDKAPAFLRTKAETQESLLIFAVQSGFVKIVEYLLEQPLIYENIEATSKGLTSLHIAATLGDADMVHVLLEAGANALIKTPAGETAIQIATREKNSAVMNTFVKIQPELFAEKKSLEATPISAAPISGVISKRATAMGLVRKLTMNVRGFFTAFQAPDPAHSSEPAEVKLPALTQVSSKEVLKSLGIKGAAKIAACSATENEDKSSFEVKATMSSSLAAAKEAEENGLELDLSDYVVVTKHAQSKASLKS